MFKLLLASTALITFVSEIRQPPTAPPAPTSLVIVACRVDDLTGQPGRHDPEMAAHGWRDLELHVNSAQEYECKREVLANLEDSAVTSPLANAGLIPLNPDFSDRSQCAHVGAMKAAEWDQAHKGWATVAIGCPVPIVNQDGRVLSWKLPECPVYRPG